MFLSDEGPTLETLDFTFHIGSTPTFLYFDLYLNTAYAAHYVYICFYTRLNHFHSNGVATDPMTVFYFLVSAVHQPFYISICLIISVFFNSPWISFLESLQRPTPQTHLASRKTLRPPAVVCHRWPAENWHNSTAHVPLSASWNPTKQRW